MGVACASASQGAAVGVRFKCRMVIPSHATWVEEEAETWEAAALEHHFREPRRGIAFNEDHDRPGSSVCFARVEVEGFGELITRVYRSSLVRRGGVKTGERAVTIEQIAERLGWAGEPAALLKVGWDLEEVDWK